MSVHKQGDGWRVKYRVGGRQRSRTFGRHGDAVHFDAEIKRRQRLGPALVAELDRSAMTLDGFVRGPWRAHAATLSQGSRTMYAWALEKHLTDLLDEPLRDLDVSRLAMHQRLLLDRGATANTTRDVMTRLSGILQIAVEYGHLDTNAARSLRKVPADAADEVRPLSPVELERLITSLDGRDRAIALLGGHLGLRPLEIRKAPWDAFDGANLIIGKARTKVTAQRMRAIPTPAVTGRELREWRLQSGRPAADAPIVGEMTANALKLWGAKSLRPAVAAATNGRITGATVYTLRHTHASALHYCGYTVPEAARRMGHAATLHLSTYAHVIDAVGRARYEDLDALIAAGRAGALEDARRSSVREL